jgi:hypothetical protein
MAGNQVQDHPHFTLVAGWAKQRLGLIIDVGNEIDEANLLVTDRPLFG